MAELPLHAEAHAYNTALGDICTRPNSMPRFLEACVAGEAALEKAGVRQ